MILPFGRLVGVSISPDRLTSIVYSSTATQPFSAEDLGELLAISRTNNNQLGLTGMLLFRSGRFLQVLEGPETAVKDRMDVIAEDPRHTAVRVLLHENLDERQFPDWTMGYEPITDSMAEAMPGYRTTFSDRDTGEDEDPNASLRGLRELIRWFQERAIPLL